MYTTMCVCVYIYIYIRGTPTASATPGTQGLSRIRSSPLYTSFGDSLFFLFLSIWGPEQSLLNSILGIPEGEGCKTSITNNHNM